MNGLGWIYAMAALDVARDHGHECLPEPEEELRPLATSSARAAAWQSWTAGRDEAGADELALAGTTFEPASGASGA